MSGLEQRTRGRNEALACPSAVTAVITPSPKDPLDLGPIDGDLLDERRASVPAFPLDLLPQPWRDWAREAARSADAPVDYVAQALLATVAGVSGTDVWVVVTPTWIEQLQLWLAVVGAPSTGKSPALAIVRRMLFGLEHERIEGLDRPPRHIAISDNSLQAVVEMLDGTWHGKLLWRDGAEGCFTPLKGMDTARQLGTLDVSILGSIEPDGVAPALQRGGDGLAARFLYAWPHAAPFCPLAERKRPDNSEVLMGPLRRLLRLVATSRERRCLLLFDEPAERAFNAFLAGLHAEVQRAEGLEAAWLGKGRGAVACLAATFALMKWSVAESVDPPRTIDAHSVEHAVSLWSDYYRPHANAFLQRAAPTNIEGQVRRVVHWLRADGRASVSRKDVRRTALAQTVNAREADRVLARLVEAGALRAVAAEKRPQGGRPALRWEVNPHLQAASFVGGLAKSAGSAQTSKKPDEVGIGLGF